MHPQSSDPESQEKCFSVTSLPTVGRCVLVARDIQVMKERLNSLMIAMPGWRADPGGEGSDAGTRGR